MAHNCAACRFRANHDKKPGSLIGRLWRWHINWCPGWKKYMKSLPGEEKRLVVEKYHLNK